MQGASLSQAGERKGQGVDPDTEGRRRVKKSLKENIVYIDEAAAPSPHERIR
jgi:hypothetical protein